MGCFSEVCAVTNTAIECGQECYMFLIPETDPYNALDRLCMDLRMLKVDEDFKDLLEEMKDSNMYRRYMALLEKLKTAYRMWHGHYNDYGSLEEVDEDYETTNKVTKMFLSVEGYELITCADLPLETIEGYSEDLQEHIKVILQLLWYMKICRLSFPFAPGNFGGQSETYIELKLNEQRAKVIQQMIEVKLEECPDWKKNLKYY